MPLDRDEFERCWHSYAHRVFAYAERHVGRERAEDVLSATFLTGWRTWHDVPDDPLPWLLAVARGQVRNQLRSSKRQIRLGERIALLEASASGTPDVDPLIRSEALRALGQLRDEDRELLLLVAWDGLDAEGAARVLGCSVGTLRVRLHRARSRLEVLLTTNARSL